MLRMTIKTQTDREMVLAVHGKLRGLAVQLLSQEIERHWRKDRRLVLDLAQVPFIDEAGLMVLQHWVGCRLWLRGGSPFLKALLAAEGLKSENP